MWKYKWLKAAVVLLVAAWVFGVVMILIDSAKKHGVQDSARYQIRTQENSVMQYYSDSILERSDRCVRFVDKYSRTSVQFCGSYTILENEGKH